MLQLDHCDLRVKITSSIRRMKSSVSGVTQRGGRGTELSTVMVT